MVHQTSCAAWCTVASDTVTALNEWLKVTSMLNGNYFMESGLYDVYSLVEK